MRDVQQFGSISPQAIDVLERALESSPSTVVVAEPFLFNLCKYLHH